MILDSTFSVVAPDQHIYRRLQITDHAGSRWWLSKIQIRVKQKRKEFAARRRQKIQVAGPDDESPTRWVGIGFGTACVP